MRVVYQFPISHYCEKTRWNLDAKGLRFDVKNVPPGVHRRVARRLAGVTTLPVLVEDGVGVGDSRVIFEKLEAQYPEPPLLPRDPAQRRRAVEIEGYFDQVGVAVRHFIYGVLLNSPGQIARVFFRGYPLHFRLLGKLAGRKLEAQIRRLYRITADSVVAARGEIEAALERLEREIAGDPTRYLVAESFSIADLTAASLLAPLAGPPRSPWDVLPNVETLLSFQRGLQARPAGRWILERYRLDRAATSRESLVNIDT
jgi:glutathione S-transferase